MTTFPFERLSPLDPLTHHVTHVWASWRQPRSSPVSCRPRRPWLSSSYPSGSPPASHRDTGSPVVWPSHFRPWLWYWWPWGPSRPTERHCQKVIIPVSPWFYFNINTVFPCTVMRPSDLINENSCAGETTSLYWNCAGYFFQFTEWSHVRIVSAKERRHM